MVTLTEKIQQQLFQVINTIIFTEKKKIIRLEEITLFPSEVHMMLFIKNDIDTNSTEIAKQLGLSKGAVSQTLTRLEKKGIIVKRKDPFNKNELTLTLTEFGRAAYTSCQSSQRAFIEAHNRYLANLGTKEKEVILGFLIHMERSISDLSQA